MNASDWNRISEKLPPVGAPCLFFVAGKDDGEPEAGNAVKKSKAFFVATRPAASDDAETLAWAEKQRATRWARVELPEGE